jgi:arylsulfatase A-like enzyme
MQPHPPYDAPVPAGGSRWTPSALVLPPNVPRGGDVEVRARRELAGYYAHVEATDRAVGTLLGRIPRQGTVVLFTSVHGDMHGAHGCFRKGWPYEESIRVPLLVRDPRRAAGLVSVRSPAPVSLIDLPRLMLACASGAVVQPEGPAGPQQISMPSVVQLPHQCDRAWRGVRTRTRKLVLGDDGEPWLFFDLERDSGEQQNLVHDPARSREMATLRELVRG